jgi:hypothetical protein
MINRPSSKSTEFYSSLYCQIEGSFVSYGITNWVSDYQENTASSEYGKLSYVLTDVLKGRCRAGDLVELVKSELGDRLSNNGCLMMEDLPENQTFKKVFGIYGFKMVKREGETLEQILKFTPLIGDRLILGEFEVKPTLMFPELGENLIDPLTSDMDTFYPLTQSFLIAAKGFETFYKWDRMTRPTTISFRNW